MSEDLDTATRRPHEVMPVAPLVDAEVHAEASGQPVQVGLDLNLVSDEALAARDAGRS